MTPSLITEVISNGHSKKSPHIRWLLTLLKLSEYFTTEPIVSQSEIKAAGYMCLEYFFSLPLDSVSLNSPPLKFHIINNYY